MKNKVIKVQNEKLLNNNITREGEPSSLLQAENTQFSSLRRNRNWENTISILEKPQLSIPQQLDRIKSEYKVYDDQEKKFKNTINNINSNKENFYPKESTSLFKEYIQLLKSLKVNLKSMEKELRALNKRKK